MRKFLITALLASTVAMPALAAPADRDEARAERQQDREDRQQAREERRESRQEARPERPERAVEMRARGDDGPARADAVVRANRADVEAVRSARQAERLQRIEGRGEQIQERIERARANRELRQSERASPGVFRPRVPVVSETPRAGTQPPLRTERRHSSPVNWSSHWRKDRRYDWYNWRNRHRSLFRLGFYYDPVGWGYQRYNIGWRMWPSYYRSSYWLNDPWQYRLPYAPPGYRWIRYYDDAILIDTWDGHVADVIYNFFW
jgi:hypothetical protein